MKKAFGLVVSAVMLTGMLAGCGTQSATNSPPASDQAYGGSFDATKAITVVSREEGSGTRDAFIELFKVQEADASGKKVDNTTEEADITNSTSVMLTKVAGDPYAIGYVSLGSMNDTVKAVQIDGAIASADNVKNGTYQISRPFNIVTKGAPTNELAKDFILYIMSGDGQKIISDNGYIAVAEAAAYSGTRPSGKIVVAGSSSVTPVMEKLKEAYQTVNPDAQIEIQQNDSTTGITSTASGVCEIGMSSRELKDTETAKGLIATKIAIDGIAVIVNPANSIADLSADQVKAIFTGESTTWSDAAS